MLWLLILVGDMASSWVPRLAIASDGEGPRSDCVNVLACDRVVEEWAWGGGDVTSTSSGVKNCSRCRIVVTSSSRRSLTKRNCRMMQTPQLVHCHAVISGTLLTSEIYVDRKRMLIPSAAKGAEMSRTRPPALSSCCSTCRAIQISSEVSRASASGSLLIDRPKASSIRSASAKIESSTAFNERWKNGSFLEMQ